VCIDTGLMPDVENSQTEKYVSRFRHAANAVNIVKINNLKEWLPGKSLFLQILSELKPL
jgi:hypothetical protein